MQLYCGRRRGRFTSLHGSQHRPIVRFEQKSATCYGSIYEAYKTYNTSDVDFLPASSISSRLNIMLMQFTPFSACGAGVEALKRSETNDYNEWRLATFFFDKNTFSNPREDIGPKFKFMPSCKVLCVLPKFNPADAATTSTGTNGNEKSARRRLWECRKMDQWRTDQLLAYLLEAGRRKRRKRRCAGGLQGENGRKKSVPSRSTERRSSRCRHWTFENVICSS